MQYEYKLTSQSFKRYRTKLDSNIFTFNTKTRRLLWQLTGTTQMLESSAMSLITIIEMFFHNSLQYVSKSFIIIILHIKYFNLYNVGNIIRSNFPYVYFEVHFQYTNNIFVSYISKSLENGIWFALLNESDFIETF